MNKLSLSLPFPAKTVFAGTAPVFNGCILDPHTGLGLTPSQCYKITLNVSREPEFEHVLEQVPHYTDVEVPVTALSDDSASNCYNNLPNFVHLCEVRDENGRPHSAFLEIGLRHRVEYAFYWRDAEGREKLPVKIVEIVSVI